MRRLFLFAAGFCAAAAGFVLLLSEPWTWILAALSILLCAAGFALRSRPARAAAIVLLGFGIGLVWCSGYQHFYLRPLENIHETTEERRLLILDEPVRTKYGYAHPVRMQVKGRSYAGTLYLDEDAQTYSIGDIAEGTFRVRYAPGSAEQGGSLYYRSRGIWFTSNPRSDIRIVGHSSALRLIPARFRVRMQNTLCRLFDDDVEGFLLALLTGDRSGLSYAERNELSVAGVYHVIAVSGMHVSVLIGMVVLLLGTRRRLAAFISIPLAIFFVSMTGASASAVRACCMQIMLLMAPVLYRENDPVTTVSTALLLLLAANPWAVYDIGLILSFSSVIGILMFSGRIYRVIWSRLKNLHLNRLKRPILWLIRGAVSALSCTIASMVFSLPIMAVAFDVVSIIAPITNILVLWAVSICFSMGILLCLVGMICSPLALGGAWLLGWLVRYVQAVAHLLAGVPYAALYPNNPYVICAGILAYGFALLTALFPGKVRMPRGLIAAAGAVALMMALSCLDYHLPEFTLTALDVGQGQCMVLHAGDCTAIFDCGGTDPDEAGETAARYLQSAGVWKADILVITHYDSDHCGGVEQLLQRVRVKSIFLPELQDNSGHRERLVWAAEKAGCEVRFVSDDLLLSPSAMQLQIYAPLENTADRNNGISVLASVGEFDMLLTGDLPEKLENQLLESRSIPEVELLAAGHHGAAASTGLRLLQNTSPQAVLVSVGKNNTYGHPADETLDRIRRYGAEVFRTDVCGTITVRR